ncbi:hypothetical protein BcepSauron_013 [Burkholderia phage BcepSauron]|uniref:Uncharacterized protein n=1 Tax=Burkholderia phage BcepSauron TaxID=2530033 RepID=A0A482MMM4_9CAUD|nr:hypothetical protein H1O17_gp013 [Burkholderia phage BcepSauron]QBQ74393.1 hypothetical protein BcepSauron_013 [Burkholderia phage BcepSauron]
MQAKVKAKPVHERAGDLGELIVFRYMGDKFGLDTYNTIYRNTGPDVWTRDDDKRAAAHAIAIGL